MIDVLESRAFCNLLARVVMTLLLYIVHKQGEALFQTHENLEHLAMMERVLGPLPQHMVLRAE